MFQEYKVSKAIFGSPQHNLTTHTNCNSMLTICYMLIVLIVIV